MKLIIEANLQTAVFFEMYHSITESYGVKINNETGYFETKEYEDNLKNALAILSLDELLTRHLYPAYETGNIEGIVNFTQIDGEHKSLNELLNFVTHEGDIS